MSGPSEPTSTTTRPKKCRKTRRRFLRNCQNRRIRKLMQAAQIYKRKQSHLEEAYHVAQRWYSSNKGPLQRAPRCGDGPNRHRQTKREDRQDSRRMDKFHQGIGATHGKRAPRMAQDRIRAGRIETTFTIRGRGGTGITA